LSGMIKCSLRDGTPLAPHGCVTKAGHWTLKPRWVVLEPEAGADDGGLSRQLGHVDLRYDATLHDVRLGDNLRQCAHHAGRQPGAAKLRFPPRGRTTGKPGLDRGDQLVRVFRL